MDTMHTLVLLYKLVCILASNIITTVVCRPGVCKRLVCTSSYTTHNAEQVKKSERERGEIDQCTLHSCVMAAASSLFLGRRGWPEGGVLLRVWSGLEKMERAAGGGYHNTHRRWRPFWHCVLDSRSETCGSYKNLRGVLFYVAFIAAPHTRLRCVARSVQPRCVCCLGFARCKHQIPSPRTSQ